LRLKEIKLSKQVGFVSAEKKPITLDEAKKAAVEFVNSDLKYAEVNVEGYRSSTALARSLGRILLTIVYAEMLNKRYM
jgi:hypothetical protein